MGTIACCNEMSTYKITDLHIYQINRYVKYTNDYQFISRRSPLGTLSFLNEESNEKNSKKQYLKNKKGEFILLSYDVEEQNFEEFKVTFPIIKTIEGMSELNIDKKLFLCGISPKQQNEGSFLFKINLDKNGFENEEQNIANVLINSQYSHIYPSLIHDKNGRILCIGGKGQTQCELYDLNMNKWCSLPQLPKERYKCSLCLDTKGDFVYLFGGINQDFENEKEDENNSEIKILRMNLVRLLIWENLIIKNNNRNIIVNRVSSAAFTFKYDEDFIFIAGGEDSHQNSLDNIIRFSIKKLKFETTGIKLKNKSIFTNQNSISIDEQTHCLIDNLNGIHIIERHDCLPIDYQPDEI